MAQAYNTNTSMLRQEDNKFEARLGSNKGLRMWLSWLSGSLAFMKPLVLFIPKKNPNALG